MEKKLTEIICAIGAVGMLLYGYFVCPQYMAIWWLTASMFVGLVETRILKNSVWWTLSFVPLACALVYMSLVIFARSTSFMSFLWEVNSHSLMWLNCMTGLTVAILVLKLFGKLLEGGIRMLARHRCSNN